MKARIGHRQAGFSSPEKGELCFLVSLGTCGDARLTGRGRETIPNRLVGEGRFSKFSLVHLINPGIRYFVGSASFPFFFAVVLPLIRKKE
jgi:hypothetical protein